MNELSRKRIQTYFRQLRSFDTQIDWNVIKEDQLKRSPLEGMRGFRLPIVSPVDFSVAIIQSSGRGTIAGANYGNLCCTAVAGESTEDMA